MYLTLSCLVTQVHVKAFYKNRKRIEINIYSFREIEENEAAFFNYAINKNKLTYLK